MARKSARKPAAQEDFETLGVNFYKFCLFTDRRFERTASKESLERLSAKLDGFIAALDHSAGELQEIRNSLAIQSAMLGEYRKRLEKLKRGSLQ